MIPGGADGSHAAAALLGTLAAVIGAAKLAGAAAQKFKQPPVLGELIVGVVLGGSVIGLLDPSQPAIAVLSEIGVVLLLFTIGLQTDLKSLSAVGGTAAVVALTGVAVPFALGFVVSRALGVATIPAVVCGAALTATSVGISARVLSDLRRLDTTEGRIVLGAAVLDDIVGLIILAVVVKSVAGDSVGVGQIAWISTAAIGFVVLALVFGARIVRPVFRAASRLPIEGVVGVLGIVFAFALAWLADRAGSAMIVGAFAAGLMLHPLAHRTEIERNVTTLGYFFVPIFFASVGAAVDLNAMASRSLLAFGGALIVVAVLGKVVAGYAPWWFRGNKLLVGVAMVPRGEVGLIFAQMGLASGALTPALYGAVMMMVLATTLFTPPVLAAVARRREKSR